MILRRVFGDQLLEPLRETPFRLFWLGQTISLLGDRVAAVALPFLVLELGGSAIHLGQLSALYSAGQVLLLLLGGVLVDRIPRRNILVITDVIRGALVAGVVALLLTDGLTLTHLYAMYLLFGLCSAFFMPATASIVPETVPKPLLMPANALRSFAGEFAGIAGPALGGILIGFGGLALALGFDALTFVVGVACLLLMRVRSRPVAPEPDKPRYWRDIGEGFRLITRSQWLWATILIFAFVNVFFAGATSVLFPLLAKERLGDPQALGWLFSGVAAGSLLGALLLGRLGRVARRGLSAYTGVAASGLALLGLSFAPHPAIAVTLAMLMGGSLVVFGVIWESTVQELVPPETLGRVYSVDMFGSFALLPLGFLAVGWLAAHLGVVPSLLVCGGAVVLLAGIGLLVPGVRNLR